MHGEQDVVIAEDEDYTCIRDQGSIQPEWLKALDFVDARGPNMRRYFVGRAYADNETGISIRRTKCRWFGGMGVVRGLHVNHNVEHRARVVPRGICGTPSGLW